MAWRGTRSRSAASTHGSTTSFCWAYLLVLAGIYFLATLTFFVFFLPVVLGAMGYGVFFLSGLANLGVVGGMLYYLKQRRVL